MLNTCQVCWLMNKSPSDPGVFTAMDPDDLEELAVALQGKTVGGWGLVQLAAGTGFAAYVMWAGVLMPGFRRVPLKLQVPYVPSSAKQVENVMSLLKGRSGKMVDLGSGDGRIVLEAYKRGFRPAVGYELNPWLLRLSNYHAWRAGCYGKVFYQRQDLWKLPLLETKLLAELPDEARVVAGRFPFPTWMPTTSVGEGINRSWAYDIKTVRQTGQNKLERSPE
ncbi:adenine nucleotide translocase lysine N-methyltransferase isoform X1 [Dermochelys coriacea]|uniref:adenine nucleotide translocase lysine N-methyltransferase isoform X1 n=1 Tax=Dermochelys coriacea TaxID=27794 RepID=UPI0018E88128|nr:adenine nucleotide translocase lysine N-methyltransferase isoform X1 [Dermochelys coriacea]